MPRSEFPKEILLLGRQNSSTGVYDLPQFNFKNSLDRILENRVFRLLILAIIILLVWSLYTGTIYVGYFKNELNPIFNNLENNFLPSIVEEPKMEEKYISKVDYEQAIIDVVKSASPSVVSIIISKNLPVYEQQFVNPFGDLPNFDFGAPFSFEIPQYVQKGTQKKQIGSGSGFIVSQDGLVLTNKHVVIDKEAEYTVLTNDGKKYSAKVLALDPVQDLAIIKIQNNLALPDQEEKFPLIKLGDSSGIQIGQGTIAIGNALGEFRNTISVGIISGLGRTVFASGSGGFSETLEDIIQTDAAINPGNSGGPLLNLKGEVIGVNVAMAQGAQSIGFAIPINVAKRDIEQVIKTNKIVYPFLGVRYVLVDEAVKQKYNLSVDYGVLLLKGAGGESAVTTGSAAEKAGLKEKDVILELNGEKITKENSLSKVIQKYLSQDTVKLKILRGTEEINIDVVLGER